MTVPVTGCRGSREVADRAWARGRDRRSGLAAVLAELSQQLRAGREPATLRPRLEDALRRLLGVDAVQLREPRVPYAAGGSDRPPSIGEAERVSLEVPTRPSGRPVVLEASFGPRTTLDEWGFQTLATAAHLAALVVELDQRRDGPPGAGGATSGRVSAGSTPPLVGSSRAMSALRDQIGRVAATDFTVLVEGESGTGKELVARQVHQRSPRRAGPFVAVNCAAIVETLLEAELFGIEERTATGVRGRRGKFEHADGGTLFLDEVSDLAPAAQAKLLRAIQELTVERVGGHGTRRVDIRLVVATNRSLRDLVARGSFREDLFYRLSGVELHVPPLRARRDDILDLARHFLSRYSGMRALRFTPGAEDALRSYTWPGNVRELERLVEGIVALARSDRVAIDDLPASLRGDTAEILLPSLARDETMRAWGSRYARLVLDRCEQNKRRACRVLGISYHTLQSYLQYRGASGPPGDPDDGWCGPRAVAGGTMDHPRAVPAEESAFG
jgi:DNA-binding NtrC family response regulator